MRRGAGFSPPQTVTRQARLVEQPPVYIPSLVSPRRGRVITMYLGLSGCVICIVLFVRSMIARDFMTHSGAMTGLIFVTCALFVVSIGVVVYESIAGAEPTFTRLSPVPKEESELPPVLSSSELIEQARSQAQRGILAESYKKTNLHDDNA